MKESELKSLLEQHTSLLVLIGYASVIMANFYEEIKNEHGGVTEQLESQYKWMSDAIQKVVYEHEPLPKRP